MGGSWSSLTNDQQVKSLQERLDLEIRRTTDLETIDFLRKKRLHFVLFQRTLTRIIDNSDDFITPSTKLNRARLEAFSGTIERIREKFQIVFDTSNIKLPQHLIDKIATMSITQASICDDIIKMIQDHFERIDMEGNDTDYDEKSSLDVMRNQIVDRLDKN